MLFKRDIMIHFTSLSHTFLVPPFLQLLVLRLLGAAFVQVLHVSVFLGRSTQVTFCLGLATEG